VTVVIGTHMVELASQAVVNVGFDFVTLTEDGLVKTDHQFVDR